MSIEKVRDYLSNYGLENEIMEFEVSSATVELAAAALGVEGARIAKTISLYNREGSGCILIVTAGDTKIDNSKFKAEFSFKAKMLSHDDALLFTGHAVGGVCPFAVSDEVHIYLDESLKRFETVFPACGSSNSAIRITPNELYRVSKTEKWVSVCKSMI